MEGWREQWERVLIGMRRVERAYAGVAWGSREAVYELISFFLHAYHLKDWLIEDEAIPALDKGKVEGAINASTHLRISADFANRSKHVVLRRPPRIDSKSGVTRQDVVVRPATVGSPSSEVSGSHAWTIAAAGTEYDVLHLARAVVREWNTLLRTEGLL